MSKYRATMKDLLEKVYKEDGHQDVSSSKRMCKTIVEDAQQIESKLNSMSPEDSLDTWWTNKLAVSANNLNKARDYIVNDIKEAKIISDISGISIPKLKKEVQPFNVKVDRVGPGMDSDYEVEFTGSEQSLIKYAKKHLGFDGNSFSQLKRHLAMEEKDIEEVSDKLKMKVKSGQLAKRIAKLKSTFLKKVIPNTGPLFADNELDEGKMKTIATMFDQGKSADEIAKALKLPVNTVKSILGEEVQIDEKIADSIIKDLQKAYGDLKGKTISPEMANKISKHLDGQSFDVVTLRQLTKAKIPFISTIARNKIYKKTGKFEEVEQPMPKEEPKKDNEKKESENKDATIASLKGQIDMLKQKLENEKNKAVKPEPNPDTGEVPLTVGVAYKHFKDKAKKEDVQEADLTKSQIKKVHDKADELPKDSFRDRYGKKQGDSVRYAVATNMVKKKLGIKEDRRLYVETIAGLKKKAEKSGMPYSILKKVYDRGMAAWKGGHRPGATQQQWAFARVNSFVTKSSGTWGGADKDLAAKVRGSK